MTIFYLLSLLPESENAKLIIMVDMVMIIFCHGHHGHQDRQENQENQTRQTDLTFKLYFPGNLSRAYFANFAMFYTGYGMDYSLNLGGEISSEIDRM